MLKKKKNNFFDISLKYCEYNYYAKNFINIENIE